MNFAKMIEKAGAIGVMIGRKASIVVKVFEDLAAAGALASLSGAAST